MQQDLEDVSDFDNEWTLSSERWSNSEAIDSVIISNAYKNIPLVEGWLIDLSVQTNKDTPVGWKMRTLADNHSDALEFLKDLRAELQRRFEQCIPDDLHKLYSAVDIAEMIKLTCGVFDDQLNEPLLVQCDQSRSHAFSKFFDYVQNLPHLKVCYNILSYFGYNDD